MESVMHNEANKKGVYAPSYYNKFKCIADRCKHSCCIDWEIYIDDDTISKYKNIENILSTVNKREDGYCFALTEDGRCPHLNESGLCDIILAHGEEYLSDICKNHPRFYNDVGNGKIEAGYGIVCEEACRLILENNEPFSSARIEEEGAEDTSPRDFDALPLRDGIIGIIESGNSSFDETLEKLKSEFGIPELYSTDEWLDIYLKLERLDDAWESTLQSAKGCSRCKTDGFDKYYSRLLIYFVYRHVSVADSEDNLRARLAFSMLSVEMIRLLFENETDKNLEGIIDISRRYSAEIEYSEDNTEDLIWEFESEFYC